MPILDVFKNAAFNSIELTDSFNVVPNNFGRLQRMNLFPARGVRTRTVAVERKNRILNVLPSVSPGGPASKGSIGKRDLRNVTIPHFPHEDVVLAEDVQGVRSFGSENELMSVQELLNEKLETMASKHDITLEYLRWSALKGLVVDPVDGFTILDLFDFMGATQEVMNFALTTGSTDVKTKTLAVKRFMELNLFGDTMSGVHVFASSGFMDSLVTHASVAAAYQFYQSSQEVLRNDVRTGFQWQGVTFEEVNDSALRPDGTVLPFVPANEAIAFPEGSQSFKTYFAPADFIETVNTPGQPRYAKQRILEYDRGIEIHTQSNPLPICLRPQLLVRLTRS